jgi:crystallin alpha B
MAHCQVHDENKDTIYLLVTGKHEEKPDEHGFVSRHFTRRYALPKDVDIKELQCNLSDKGPSARVHFARTASFAGILTLQAPRKQLTLTANNTRAIPITHVANAPMLGEKTPVEKKLAALKGY